jgi:hypothetical protein
MEEWRDIPGFEKCYQVSDLGRVRSVDREYKCIRGGKILTGHTTERILVPFKSRKYKPCLRVDIGEKSIKVHRLVAFAFLPNPNNYPTVDHINRDPSNNNLSNLRWASMTLQAENRDSPIGITGQKYISTTKSGFRVRVTRNSIRTIVGSFKTLPEAIEARDKYLNELPEIYNVAS